MLYNIRFSKSVLCSEVRNSYLYTQRMGLFEQPGYISLDESIHIHISSHSHYK